jgi:hypothetical protein
LTPGKNLEEVAQAALRPQREPRPDGSPNDGKSQKAEPDASNSDAKKSEEAKP